jgi:metal-responsive CopG/Arc/MetJ family transcriptional regulator
MLEIIIHQNAHLEGTMESVRINISLPKEVFDELTHEVESRKRSRFVTEAIKRLIKDRKDQRLASEYREAAGEIRRINQDLEGVINDGLD